MVLIVDNDPVFVRAAKRALPPAGHAVVVATSVAEGIDVAKVAQPDVIIFDAWFDERNCIAELPRLIAVAPRAKSIVVAAHLNQIDRGRSRGVGALAYLPKSEMPRVKWVVRKILTVVEQRKRRLFSCPC